MEGKIARIGRIAGVLILTLTLVAGCTPKNLEGTLTILHAGSLTIPFEEIREEFNRKYPEVKIEMEARGSRATIRQVTDLGRRADVVASADYSIILPMMSPQYADWYIAFAHNEMVIAYTDRSAYGNEINEDNWYKILAGDPAGKGVTYGHSNPDIDPCGYRALMVWQLAERYYKEPGLYKKLLRGNGRESRGREVVRGKEVDLLALLETGELDYAFEYLSIAKQHHLKYIKLASVINLSSEKFEELYATAKVEVAGKKLGEMVTYSGKAIIYGLTIPRNAVHPDLAVKWIEFLLSPQGREIMERNGQPPLVPARANDIDKLPPKLRKYVGGWGDSGP